MHKLIISNGVDLNPAYTDRIAVSKEYFSTEVLAASTSLAAGGSLVVGTKYYYKVAAIMRKKVKVDGDTAGQLTGLGIDGPTSGKLYWKLKDSAGTRSLSISRDRYGFDLVASGSRAGDGAIVLEERNQSKVSGLVTVNYTADDVDTSNSITIEHGVFIVSAEDSETTTAVNATVDVSWTPVNGEIDGYRIYRGTAAGCYDGFFVADQGDTLFSDDGTKTLMSDEQWFKHDIRLVSGVFLPAGSPQGYAFLNKCCLHVNFNKADRLQIIDLTKVSNHPTWSTGVMASVYTAQNDFNEWL
jgi:hypothetical protein